MIFTVLTLLIVVATLLFVLFGIIERDEDDE